MREIQDLTLNRERGLSLVNARFDERKEAFLRRNTVANPSYQNDLMLRATLIPISTDLWIDDMFGNDAVKPLYQTFRAEFEALEWPLKLPRAVLSSRPILGGVRYSYGSDQSRHEPSRMRISQEVLRDGLIEFSIIMDVEKYGFDAISPEWFCGLTMNAILTAHRFRTVAGAPEAEYGLEVEIWRTNGDIHVARLGASSGSDMIGTAEPNPLAFQRMSIGPVEEIQKVMANLLRDLVNAAGGKVGSAFEVVIPDALVSA